MAYIKVNINEMTFFKDLFEDIYRNTVAIRNKFVEYSNEIDWDVKNESGVYESISRIVSEFKAEQNSLVNMTNYLNKAATVYYNLDIAACVRTAKSVTSCVRIGNNSSASKDSIGSVYDGMSFDEHWVTKFFKEIMGGVPILGPILGFNSFGVELFEDTTERLRDLETIQKDSSLTDKEKDDMSNIIETMANVEVAFDTLAWATSCVPLAGPIFGFVIDDIGEALNSDDMQEVVLESYQEIEDAKKKFHEADGAWEKIGAGLTVGWECLEAATEVLFQGANSFIEEVATGVVETIENVVVEPVKNFVGWFGRATGWW